MVRKENKLNTKHLKKMEEKQQATKNSKLIYKSFNIDYSQILTEETS